MKALIFGANGQDGYYLSESCLKKNIEVIGVSRSGPWIHGDVASSKFVEDLIRSHHPSYIFHLAASSTTKHDAIYDHNAAIATGTVNILESVKKWSPKSKVFITGSGLQFINRGQPITEFDPFGHDSIYVAARNYSVYLARYFRSLGICTYVGYLFHHESPLRSERYVSQMIALKASRIGQGSNEIIEIGDLSIMKEWTYAKDIAEAILTLVNQDKVFEAVIGSGLAYSIKDWLDACFKLINKNWESHIKENSTFNKGYQILVSNPVTINSIGWKATTSIGELAKIMVDHNNSSGRRAL